MRVHHLFLIPLLLCSLTAFSTDKNPVRISGIYSDLEYNEEDGDLLGTEVFIIPSSDPDDAYQVFIQIAEGEAPFTALVPVKVTGAKIEFTLPQGGAYAGEHFVGKITDKELVLHQEQGNEEHLKRGKSYWQ